jgi:hypothetical protein
MTDTASPAADHKPPSFDRRVAFACLGMACGLVMGLFLWCFDLITGHHHAVIPITLGLILLEGVIGAVVAQQDKGKLDDLLTIIIAFFVIP